jgi:hypothetical protein
LVMALATDVPAAAGACKADVKALCKDVSPGDDRLLLCLVKRMKQAQQGNIAGAPCCPCNATSNALGRGWMCPLLSQLAWQCPLTLHVCTCVSVCRPASVGKVSAGCCKVQD